MVVLDESLVKEVADTINTKPTTQKEQRVIGTIISAYKSE